MKKIITILLYLISTQIIAQNYGNEWIDYDKTYHKIQIEQTGIYRLNTEILQTTDIPLTGNGFQLFYKGEQIPIYVSTQGTFGENDYIEFFATKNDGTFDTQLFPNPDGQLDKDVSLFTDIATYFLTWDDTTPNLRIENQNNDITNPPTPETHYWHTEKVSLTDAFFDGIPTKLYGWNSYFSHFEDNEGFISTLIIPEVTKEIIVPTPFIYQEGFDQFEATIKTKFIGRSQNSYVEPDHQTQIFVNDVEYIDVLYEGYQKQDFLWNVALQNLTDNNIIKVQNTNNIFSPEQPNYTNKSSVAFVSIDYPRQFIWTGDTTASIKFENGTERYLEIDNIVNQENLYIQDLTNKKRFNISIENNTYKCLLSEINNLETERQIILFQENQIQTIDSLQSTTFTNYSLSQNQGNYLIITHPILREGTTDQVQRYEEYRQSSEGGNYDVQTVHIQELYDQFAYGIISHPLSIKNFINFALQNWTTPPEHLFLLGKGVNYRYTRPNPNLLTQSLIPPYGINSNDIRFSTPDNFSTINQIATGRLNANNNTHVKNYLDKVISYENALNYNCESEIIKKLSIATAYGSDQLNHFKNNLQEEDEIILNGAWNVNIPELSYTQNYNVYGPDSLLNLAAKDSKIIHYLGKGNGTYWQAYIDPQQLDNNPFIISSCGHVSRLSGIIPNDSSEILMTDRMILSPNKGAIAFWGINKFGPKSYETYNGYENNYGLFKLYTNAFFQNATTNLYGETIGNIIKKTNEDIFDPNVDSTRLVIDRYNYHGDPAIKLAQAPHADYSPISIENTFPTTINSEEPIELAINIQNKGKIITQSINYKIERLLPTEVTITVLEGTLQQTNKDSTHIFNIPTSPYIIGASIFTITLNPDQDFEEGCYENNSISLYKYFDTCEDCTTNLNTINDNTQPKVYPNPAKQNITIEHPKGIQKIRFFNATGKVIHTWQATKTSKINISCQQWNTGIYFVEIHTTKGIIWKQIEVVH